MGLVTSWLNGLGQKLAIGGALKSPTSIGWNFVSGVTAAYNAATGFWDLTVTGGGGGGGTGDVVGPGSSVDDRVALFNGTTGKLIKVASFLIGDLIKKNGSVAFTSDQSMGGHKLTNLANGSAASQDAASVAQVEALVAAGVAPTVFDFKDSVKAATVTALPASTRVSNVRTANANGAFPGVDGVTIGVGESFLDKDNATGADRGYWTLTNAGSGGTPWVLTRRTDFDTSAEVTTGATCFVEQGTTPNAQEFFFLATTGTITLNTTSLTFTKLDGLPNGSAIGQTLVWNGSAWVAGALDLADSDARTGSLPGANVTPNFGSQNVQTTGLVEAGKGVYYLINDGTSLGATPTIDLSAGADFKGVLTANCTPTVTPPTNPETPWSIRLKQDGTGGRTFAIPGSWNILGATPYIDPTPNAETWLNGWWDGTTMVLFGEQLSRFGPRGASNISIDLIPSTDSRQTLTTGSNVTVDFALSSNKTYRLTYEWWVNDGSGGACLFQEMDLVTAEIVSGAAVLVKTPDQISYFTLAGGYVVTISATGTSIRGRIDNTSGTTRKLRLAIGAYIADKPS